MLEDSKNHFPSLFPYEKLATMQFFSIYAMFKKSKFLSTEFNNHLTSTLFRRKSEVLKEKKHQKLFL